MRYSSAAPTTRDSSFKPASTSEDDRGTRNTSRYRYPNTAREDVNPTRASYKGWAGAGAVLGVALTLYHLRSISPVADWHIWVFELAAHPAIFAAIGLAGAGINNFRPYQ
jgi:hypothetical protein